MMNNNQKSENKNFKKLFSERNLNLIPEFSDKKKVKKVEIVIN